MSRIILNGEPQLSGDTLYWAGTVDPGTFEAASNVVDTVDCFRMTSHDPAGIDVQSDLLMQAELTTDSVMPGDSYQQSVSLAELHDGYYHVMLSLDSNETGAETYKLQVRVEGGSFELKNWLREY